MAVPEVRGFRVEWRGAALVAVRDGSPQAVLDLLERDEHALDYPGGRGTVRVLPGPSGSGDSVVYKRYRRGGLLGRLFGGLRFGWQGLFRELETTIAAAERGLDVPEVLAVRATNRLPGLYAAEACLREIPDAQDLAARLSLLGPAGDPRARHALIRAVAIAIRRMHDAGLWHADLNARNILVRGGQGTPALPRVYLIDFDRARWMREIPPHDRESNLVRLHRSTQKIEALRLALTWTDPFRFLKAYAAPTPWGRTAKERLLRRSRWDLAWHRCWWTLLGRDARDASGARA
ncbi:MAG: phosphotransferase [Planctomycetes bacterium]|nr:phosphotransferase [Planctomycetota bacterium]